MVTASEIEALKGTVSLAAGVHSDPLDQLRRLCARHPGRFEKLIRTFLKNCSELVDGLRAAASGGDGGQVEMAAHSLKSSSAQFACEHLSTMAAAVETDAREGRLAAAVAALPALYDLVAADQVRLRALLETDEVTSAGSGNRGTSGA